jgi:hypothetical protein
MTDSAQTLTKGVLSEDVPANARRIWVTINELNAPDWGIGGHTDWLRDYTSALDDVGAYMPPA